jgi:hypothetical protein
MEPPPRQSRTDAAARRDRELRALTALYGGLGEDLLPGVEPLLDVDAFVDRPWPIGWVCG